MLTDKTVECHNYEAIYRPLFGPERLNGKSVLEIGIYKGGSIKWWLDEFNAERVVGMDIRKYPRGVYDDRARYIYADAYKDEGLRQATEFGPYDLIVEDGPHTLPSQIVTAREYSKLLAPGGLLCIEDIWTESDAVKIASHLPDTIRERCFIANTNDVGSKTESPSRMLVASLELQ